MPDRQNFKFPKRFLWGAATSAHQAEGGNYNQWSIWELENAKSLATQAPYQFDDLENWSDIKKDATNPANYVSGKAANHYELYEQDIELLQRMNMNAYRFSIEWSRIEPEQGAWNVSEVEHYRKVLEACRKRGITPVVTLFHFSLPVWFAEMGGFEKKSNVRLFADFAERVLQELGDAVTYVITVNEPVVYATECYREGRWPPQGQSWLRMRRVIVNLALAHNMVASRLHENSRRYKVSVAKNSVYVYPGDDSILSVQTAAFLQYLQDDYYLKKVIKSCDFLGINFYFGDRIYGYRTHNPDNRFNDVGWDMQPQLIQRVLERLSEKYDKPILITENGLADSADAHRQWWITQTIIAMQKAMANGVELIGYIHWSLLDNFEWDKGTWPRFGLIKVDYRTMKRTPRASAVWFAKILKKIRG